MQQRNVNDSNTKTGTAHYCAHAEPFCEERRAAGVELSGGMENGKPRITWVTDGTWLKKDVTCSMGFWVQVALGTSVLTGPTRQIPSRYVDHEQPRQTNNCSLNDCHAVIVYCSGGQWDFAGIHNTSSVPISKMDFDDYLLKGLQGFPPQVINVLVQGSELHRGTSINWLIGTNHPPGHNKRCSSHPPRLGKINSSRARELPFFFV